MIDIIIPVLNEEKILHERQDYYARLGELHPLTFVDGGSTDATVSTAARFGQVLSTRPGRSYQKNYGAAHTTNEFLFFLNVDSFVSPTVLRKTEDILSKGAQAGCYTLHINDVQPIFRLYEWAVNLRARRSGIIDADLGMYIRREVFEALDGFDPLIIMDDIVFSKRLRARCPVTVLDMPIFVSARKWHEHGFMKTFCQYSLAYLQLWTGIPFFRDRYQTNEQKTSANCLCPRTETRSG